MLKHALLTYLLSTAIILPVSANPQQELPSLGDSASSYVSLQQEHDLGRLWLRQLRGQTTIIDDPLTTVFLENLIYRLVPHSEVTLTDFEFVVVDQRELNAFAVPGGIIGINYGIYLHTRDEDELSAVLAHELAHLSQRHFARRIEAAEKQDPIAIATLLASILLIATNNPDAGFAGLIGSQAASIQSSLAYSRDWEREADRIGIKTLAAAGLDPTAMPSMFQQMLLASRHQSRPPEFLLTHPVTESRVSDAAGRAEHYPKKPRLTSFEFRLMQHGALIRYQLTPKKRLEHFEKQLTQTRKNTTEQAATLYSLAALTLENNSEQALAYLQKIPSPWQDHSATVALKALVLNKLGQHTKALTTLTEAMPFSPNDFVLLSSYADILLQQKNSAEAVRQWRRLSELRPSNPYIWQRLAVAAAEDKQQVLAYRANAEVLFNTGRQQQALRQMELALRQAKAAGDFQQEAALKQRLQTMANAPTRF